MALRELVVVTPLSRTPHEWPEGVDPPVPYPCECQVCGFELGPNVEPRPMCPGSREKTLNRRVGLKRSKGLKPVSDTNSGREHQKDEAFREYVRGLPCLVCGKAPSDPHHVLTWGSGRGDWVEGRGNLTPLCREHHGQVDAPGWGPTTFEARHGIDLESEAIRIGEQYREDVA